MLNSLRPGADRTWLRCLSTRETQAFYPCWVFLVFKHSALMCSLLSWGGWGHYSYSAGRPSSPSQGIAALGACPLEVLHGPPFPCDSEVGFSCRNCMGWCLLTGEFLPQWPWSPGEKDSSWRQRPLFHLQVLVLDGFLLVSSAPMGPTWLT